MSDPRPKCDIDGCPDNSVNTWGRLNICAYHYPFFTGQGFGGHAVLDGCSRSECKNAVIDSQGTCYSHASDGFKVNHDISKKLDKICKFYNAHKRNPVPYTLKMLNYSKFSGTLMTEEEIIEKECAYVDSCLAKLKKDPEPIKQETSKNKKRISKEGIKQEASIAAIQVICDRLVVNFQHKVPLLLKSLHLSDENTNAISDFLKSQVGNFILVSALAGMASYMPIPATYEEIAIRVAETLRISAMTTLGVGTFDIFSQLLKDFMLDIKQEKETLFSIQEVVTEEPFTIDAK